MRAPDTVLITGAGGFVGAALAEGFAALGWQVAAVDRMFDDAARVRLTGCQLIAADLGERVPDETPAASVVIHAAAVTTDPAERGWTPAAHIAANTRPLLTMLAFAARTRPAAFVFLSSSGVFAPEDGAAALTDHDLPTGASPYAAAKRAGELLTAASLAAIVPAHVVRLGYLYGPHEAARPSRTRCSPVARWVEAARAGRALVVPDDDPARDWTFTPDLAPVLAAMVTRPPAGRPVHLCSPHVMRDSDMAARIAALVPGATYATAPASARVKSPMRASDLSALGPIRWTAPDEALATLLAAQVPA